MAYPILESIGPNEVQDYSVDFINDIGASPITTHSVTPSAGLELGDGSTQFTTPVGNVTPAAPAAVGSKVVFWVHATAAPPSSQTVTVRAIVGTRVYTQTVSIDIETK